MVLANVNPAQVEDRYAAIADRFAGPVLRLWEPAFASPEMPLQREAA